MGYIELVIVALGLSMDAFAVSVCKGLSLKQMSYRNAITAGGYFGFFQAAMPLLGYVIGIQFKGYIESIDHWIAFFLLVIIGAKMLKESKTSCPVPDETFGVKSMIILAIATSIDAFAIGITFAFLNVNIVFAVIVIGIVTFVFSFTGVRIGCVLGSKLQSKAEIFGGIVLILMGTKILLEHTLFI